MATRTLTQPKETARKHRSWLLRIGLWSVTILGALLVAAVAWAHWRSHAALPQLDGSIEVAGLSASVQVLRDARGVPHIRAQSLDDLVVAQGYVHAQDRLWQMDLSRRLAMGELSEIFGERTLAADIENRTLGFPQVAARAFERLDATDRRLLSAYVRGVNAFIDAHQDRLPIEFAILRYKPRPWRETDSFGISLNMSKTLNNSWRGDILRERVRKKLNEYLFDDLFLSPSLLQHPVAVPVPGPAEAVPRRTPLASDPLPASTWNSRVDPVLAALTGSEADSSLALGSNNWVVSGAHTQSGKPLLANDPHLSHGIPSVWYMNHLSCPGLNVTGVSLAGGPLVIIGHNERIAWGMTNTGPDVQDLYVETFNFREPRKYLHNSEWLSDEEREEIIKVHGERDYHLKVKSTRHGPIIAHDGDRDLALRWTAIEPGALTFPFLKMAKSQNWGDFTSALRDFASPEQNIVYADVDGNIGYYAPALVPIRKAGNGSLPVRGDTDEFDWTGTIPFEGLPHAFNPPGGIIATANSRVVPDGYPYMITWAWGAPPYRTARIYQLLKSKSRLTVSDMQRVQMDIHPLDQEWLAKRLVEAGARRPPADTESQYALGLLRAWDGEARADSAAPLICGQTLAALRERVIRPKLGEELARTNWSLSAVFLQNVIDNKLRRWLPPGDADFDVTLMKSMEEGLRRVEGQFRTRDHSAWRWGDSIPLIFHHPLGSVPLLGLWLDVGPFSQAGTVDSVKAATPSHGPSMRMVVDFANLDRSVQNLTLGESGQVFSPYYRDQFTAWYTGRSYPMLFSDAAVDAGARHRLVLKPATGSP